MDTSWDPGNRCAYDPEQQAPFYILNASPTEVHWIAFAGHAMQVISLDGNRLPVQKPSRRRCGSRARRNAQACIAELNNPASWILGEVRKHVQAAGMAIAVEYAGSAGKPQWQQPQQLIWDYSQFADTDTSASRAGRNGKIPAPPLHTEIRWPWRVGPLGHQWQVVPHDRQPRVHPRAGAIVLSSATTAKTIIPFTCIVTASRWCASPAVRDFADYAKTRSSSMRARTSKSN